MLFENIASSAINLVNKRFRGQRVYKSWPNDWVPFHWTRPIKVPGYVESGDLSGLGEPDPTTLLPQTRASKELNQLDVNNPLRKIFSLSHNKRSCQSKYLGDQMIRRLGVIHKFDYNNSFEARIINLTYALRHYQEAIQYEGFNGRFNGILRSRANSILYKRNHHLYDLKEIHGDRYRRIVKLLQIEQRDNLINVPNERPYRKVQMRRLAIEYARAMKEKKVEDFIRSLEPEKKEFEQEKIDTLKWIKEQEEYLSTDINVQI